MGAETSTEALAVATRLGQELTADVEQRAQGFAEAIGGDLFRSSAAFDAGVHAGMAATILALVHRGLLDEASILAAAQEPRP